MEEAKAAGFRTGNVTTSEITDATPAAQFSHVTLRGCQGPDFAEPACEPGSTPIAEQIARNNVADVIFGGGLARFEPDDETVMEANGYKVLGSFGDPALPAQTADSQRVATRAELRGVGGRDKRVIGLFNRGNLRSRRRSARVRAGPRPVSRGSRTRRERRSSCCAAATRARRTASSSRSRERSSTSARTRTTRRRRSAR